MLINKITTKFGDHSSLLPLFTKDVINSAGTTAFSYNAGGKIEAKDKGIDEFGTQAIWLGGLPFFKWGSDKTIYKVAKINPDIDVRLIKDKVQLSHAKKYANTMEDKTYINSLLKASKKSGLTKTLFFTKFAAATLLTMASYFTLVKVKQNYTHKQIEKEFWAKKSELHYMNKDASASPAFKSFNIEGEPKVQNNKPVNSNKPSFKGLGSMFSAFMYNPVLNLSIVDASISGERIANSRTKTERSEILIKEGTFLFFMYCAGQYIQKGIEYLSSKLHKPIDLHAEVLDSSYLKESMKNGKALKDIETIKNLSGNADEFYKFVYNPENANNTVIKAAKQSNVIETIKIGNWFDRLTGKAINTHKINPLKFISQEKVVDTAKFIEKLINEAPKDINGVDKYLKSCRNMKVISVAANMSITCMFLGVILPYAIMKFRAHQQDGKKDFHVRSEIENQLEKNFKARMV